MTTYTVRVDEENNAEAWWDALRAHPTLGQLPIAGDGDECSVTEAQLTELTALPGWDDADAPSYARHPLLVETGPELSR